MFIRYMLIFNILLVTYLQRSHCTEDKKKYFKNDDLKYIFYEVNPAEGFNLRRDVFMRFALMVLDGHLCGLMGKCRLVLPPWHRMYHWRESTKPLYWGEFFDVNYMRSFAPVVEMYEVFDNLNSKVLQIDTMYILQNYENAFDADGHFREKWNFNPIYDDCKYRGNLWGFKNITVAVKKTHCIQYQGKINKLMELVFWFKQDKTILFVNGEIPLHDTYGSQKYWDLRRTVQFHRKFIEASNEYKHEELACFQIKCTNYLAVHWRRGDFAKSRKNLVPTVNGTANQIDARIRQFVPNIKQIFIATDAEMKEYSRLENRLKKLGYQVFRFLPKISDIAKYKEGGIAIIDQILCARAAYFIGTHESTFTFRIQEERELLEHNSDTTFNILCPDKGTCEKPSIWKALPP